VRARYLELRSDEAELRAILRRGADYARTVASATLAEMKTRMGFS
jgi:hypothetical protein